MNDFVLVDLQSQWEAVNNFVKDWQVDDVISWMAQYGTITENTNPFGTTNYVFQSPAGKKTAFYFTDAGKLVLIQSGWLMY